MRPVAWQYGRIVDPWYPRLWGIRKERMYRWDEPIGFRIRFGFGSWFAEYTSKGARG